MKNKILLIINIVLLTFIGILFLTKYKIITKVINLNYYTEITSYTYSNGGKKFRLKSDEEEYNKIIKEKNTDQDVNFYNVYEIYYRYYINNNATDIFIGHFKVYKITNKNGDNKYCIKSYDIPYKIETMKKQPK